LGTAGKDIDVPIKFGRHYDNFDVTKPEVEQFVKDVLLEIFDLFPSEVIHIGGDEVGYKSWDDAEHVQKYMKENGINTSADLQIYFVNKISKFIEANGRRMMGWNEIMGKNIHKGFEEKKDELKILSEEIWAEHRDVLEILLQHNPKRNGGLLQLLRDKNYTDVDLTVDYDTGEGKKPNKITLKKDGLLWDNDNNSYLNTKKLYQGLFRKREGRESGAGASETYDKVKWLKLDGEHLGQKYLDSESDYKDIEKVIDDLKKKDSKYNRLTF
jgi:hypothetical protein